MSLIYLQNRSISDRQSCPHSLWSISQLIIIALTLTVREINQNDFFQSGCGWMESEWEMGKKKIAMLSQCPLSMKVKDKLKCTNLLLLPVICCSQARDIRDRRGPGLRKVISSMWLYQNTDYNVLINNHLLLVDKYAHSSNKCVDNRWENFNILRKTNKEKTENRTWHSYDVCNSKISFKDFCVVVFFKF